MFKKRILLRYFLITIGLLPFFIMAILFVPGMQKYLVENQLNSWISNASVDAIHISPFTIKIDNLKFKYEALDIYISHLDGEISPFSLLSQRIKIDKFELDHININDSSRPTENKDDSSPLFYGLFPYFNTGFIYDIGLLDVHAEYNSSATGKIQLSVSGQAINENTDNPLILSIIAKELQDIPDIQGVTLNSSITLEQQIDTSVNAQQSHFNLLLTGTNGTQQSISAQLAMKQLPKPEKWANFPFDKRQTHYLKERLHPESIVLQIIHTNKNKQVLSDIYYDGQYDGNEGILSGEIKLLTDKEFTGLFKSLALPRVESQLSASFQYNTRSLEGNINLLDEFKIQDYMPVSAKTEKSSLPEQIDITNHLIASIDDKRLVINSFLLNMLSDGQDHIKIVTNQPLSIKLNDLPEFLEQQNNDLLQINISHLPLHWLNDFIPDYQIKNGFLDANINLALENKTLKLISNRPLSLKDITILETVKDSQLRNQETNQQGKHPYPDKEQKIEKQIQTMQPLLANQNVEADFSININKENLDAAVKQLKLYQKNNNKITEQISSSLTLNLKDPVHFIEAAEETTVPPLTVATRGKINIRALTKIPVISRSLDNLTHGSNGMDSDAASKKSALTLSESLPEVLSLNYDLGIKGKSTFWSINKSALELSAGKKQKKTIQIFTLNNSQAIQFKQKEDQLDLLTTGELFSSQINQFNFDWLAPLIKKYAAPYKLSGQLAKLDFSISSAENTKSKLSDIETTKTIKPETKQRNFLLDVKQLRLSHLKSYENEQLLFDNININSEVHADYSADKLTINYPALSIKNNKALLIHNSGKIIINNPDNEQTQHLSISGKLDGYLHHIINLNIVNRYTKDNAKLDQQSLLDAQYNLTIQDKKLTLKRSEFKILHPKSNGQLILKTHKPVSVSLKNKQYNFSQNGHLSFELINFHLNPYESMFSELPISFTHANGHFDLMQTANKQKIILKKPFNIHNIHFKDKEKSLLNPFNATLDFAATQHKNITQGEIKQLSIVFINKEKNKETDALDLNAKFKLDMDKEIILSELDGSLDLIITQWLKQPAAIPDNTLSQGTLNTRFSLDKNNRITHQWLINNLAAENGEQLVESISINGTGQLKSLSSFNLDLPIIMKSISGESSLMLKTQTTLQGENKKIAMNIDGKEVFLNDLLKLLAIINPQSEISQLETTPEPDTDSNSDNDQSKEISKSLDKTPAQEPFWKSGFNISTQLKIDTLFYSDYMSFNDIMGDLSMNDEKLHAKNFKIKFHDSPMILDAIFDFDKNQKKPYDIKFNTSLGHFEVGKFLKELNPKHTPRADGVFDVDIKIYGDLSNLTQFRNELLFDMTIEGKEGVYHLIPADDVMMRSSGTAMAVVGEVVSVLPTAGFGLGIVNRVIRFAKDIHYDFIKMHLVRQDDLHTTIEEFRIISPELHLLATGGLTFAEDTRLFDQPLEMTAQINLAGEGAAIFYGLGLLHQEQDEYGFWKGPVINFSGTLSNQQDNFNDIINKAKAGTLAGGITNPFSGIIGNFKYRWFGHSPEYSEQNKHRADSEKTITPSQQQSNKETSVKAKSQNRSFFDETFQ